MFDRLLRRTSHPGCSVLEEPTSDAPADNSQPQRSKEADHQQASATKQQEKRWNPGQGTTVFALKALTPEAGAFAAFGRMITINSADLNENIRREARCPEAEVRLLEPRDWNAPQIPGLTQNHVIGAYPLVVARASEALTKLLGVDGLDPQGLTGMGAGAMPHPSGHILFLFRIPGQSRIPNDGAKVSSQAPIQEPVGDLPGALSTVEPNHGDTIADADGNVYQTVKIGDQLWAAQNLRTTKLSDGTPIPGVSSGTQWAHQKGPAYCWYDNDVTNQPERRV